MYSHGYVRISVHSIIYTYNSLWERKRAYILLHVCTLIHEYLSILLRSAMRYMDCVGGVMMRWVSLSSSDGFSDIGICLDTGAPDLGDKQRRIAKTHMH